MVKPKIKNMKTYKSNLPELSIKYKKSGLKITKIKSSQDCADFFKEAFDADTIDYEESVMCLYLNRANETIGYLKVSSGGLNACLVDVRKVMSVALQSGASSLIISHNHPSGQTHPSEADKSITRKLVEAGKILDINLLDHIIITSENGYFSFADNCLI
jgi:DNA repair protein RadC